MIYVLAFLALLVAYNPDPNNKQILNNKGYSLFLLGNYTQAIELYDKALKIDPKFLDALANKGSAFYRIGHRQMR